VAAAQKIHRLQMRKRGRADLAFIGLVRAVGDQIDAELALGGFHRRIDLPGRHAKAFCVEFEVMDQRFHRALHLAAARGEDLVVLHRDRTLPIWSAELRDALSHDAHRLTHLFHADQIAVVTVAARDLKVSRNTVRKVLRSGETLFEYERLVQPRPKLGRWASELDALLAANVAKSAREQLTLIRIFEELRGRGYDGGYDAVRRYARRWSKERGQSTAAAYVPLSFAPGEAYQFDWSHEVVLLSGTTVMVKVAHVRLCHSRMLFARAYPRETQEMVFDAHDRAFALFKGTCIRGIYDNMKTAVETIFVGKDRRQSPLPADV